MKPEISIVVTCFNEEKNLPILVEEIRKVMKTLKSAYEIIVIDDGSCDNSFVTLLKIKKSLSLLKVIKLRRNFGQSAATLAGFKEAKGKIIVALDGDLQNDPVDIPRLIKKIKEGYDVVSGWRYQRQVSFPYFLILKIGGFLRKWLIGFQFHDAASTPNAYRRETLQELELYGEMHRFLVPILAWQGWRITEIKVNHRPRQYGYSKYNLFKSLRGFLDLLLVRFWQSYSSRPIHIFGTLGLIFSLMGLIIGLEESARKLVFGLSIYNRTLPLLAVFLMILGVQFIALGILADIMVRIYYKNKNTFCIEKII